MAYFNEFPHTRTYDSDLGWLIRHYKKLEDIVNERYDQSIIKTADPITWDITTAYEQNTIVVNDGDGYISRKPVPDGVNITNEEYWIKIIDYPENIDELEERIDILESDELVLIGDSYGVDSAAGGTSWITLALREFPNAYHTALGGTGFASDIEITVSTNWLQMLQALNITDKNKIKMIFIMGGANDANQIYSGHSDAATLENRIAQFMQYAAVEFPNAKVYVAFAGWYDEPARTYTYIQTKAYYSQYISRYKNAVVVDGIDNIMHCYGNINHEDHVHPVLNASYMLYQGAVNIIKSRSDYYNWNAFFTTPPFTGSAAIDTITGAVVYIMYKGNMCNVRLLGTFNNCSIRFKLTQPIQLATGQRVTLGHCDYFPCGAVSPYTTPAHAVFAGTQTGMHPVQIEIVNGDLRIQYVDSPTLANVTDIVLIQTDLNVPLGVN